MIRVLVVDDSAVVRQVFGRGLQRDPEIEVVGCAPDPYVARDMIMSCNPDVVTLDIEMPRMDGLTFLRKLMHFRPTPVVVVSSLSKVGGELAMDALSLGAVEVLCKSSAAFSAGDLLPELRRAVKAAAGADVRRRPQFAPRAAARCLTRGAAGAARKSAAPVSRALSKTTQQIFAIGASTGGTSAVECVLREFAPDHPGTIIAQHMPPAFTGPFAARLARETGLNVKEASDGDAVSAGVVLIAPGAFHMKLRRSGARYYVQVKAGPRVNGHSPSVDVLFNSVARTAGRNAVGALLTGMGRDGAKGLLAMREAGAVTSAQEESSCVVFGMPRAAIEIDAAQHVVGLAEIASLAMARTQGSRPQAHVATR